MKEYTRLIFLFIGAYAVGIFFLGLIINLIYPQIFPFASYALLIAFLFLAFYEVKISVVHIFKPYALILEKYGWRGEERAEIEILNPGFHFVCQRFGIYSLHTHFEDDYEMAAIFTEEHSIPIKVVVPFKNVTGEINAEIIVKIEDLEKFAYAHKNSRDEVISGTQASLRHYFSHLTIDQANEKRGLVNLDVLFNFYDEKRDAGLSPAEINKNKKKSKTTKENSSLDDVKSWNETEFGKRLIAYGYLPINFKVISIEYPESAIEAREGVYVAEKEGRSQIITSRANKKTRQLEGQAERDYVSERNKAIEESIQTFIKAGFSAAEAKELLQSNEYHRALIAAEKVVAINSGGSSNASTGAEIAAGIAAYNESKK